ncbi:hypothetical protein [Nonomuraea sp. JJY05]|uniref:hypothetical protein n=1 Tax=Nonomuraea sp. JJY05 TaxID=3350255 RepID=UPI00373ED171
MGVVLLAVGGGLLAMARVDVPPLPEDTPVEQPTDSPSPAPPRVTLDPPRVPAGTEEVRVNAACPSSFTVSSDALPYDMSLDPPGGEVELVENLTPGKYRVLVNCEESSLIGTAELVVMNSTATPAPSVQARIASTYVTLTQARPGAWRAHPQVRGSDVGAEPGDVPYELTVTHELRVPADDPDVAALRSGTAALYPDAFATSRLGDINPDPNSSDLPVAFAPPVVRLERGASQAVVTLSGRTYGFADPDNGGLVGIEYSPPSGEDVLPLTAHELVISATGWTVGGTRGAPPLTQDRHYLRVNAQGQMKAGFLKDGLTGSVAGYLFDGGVISQYIEGSEEPRVVPDERAEPEFFPRSWTALQTVFAGAAVLALLYAFVRALGAAWWARRRNRVLVLFLSALVVGTFTGLGLTMILVALIGLPLLSLISAARAVSDARPAPVAAGAAALTGTGLSLWALWMLTDNAVLLWSPAALVVAMGVTAAVPRWRRTLPVVAFVVLVVGAFLAGRVVVGGIVPGPLLWFSLIAVCLSVLAVGWVTEASHRWSARTAALCVVTVLVAVGVPSYAAENQWTVLGLTADETWRDARFLATGYWLTTYGTLLLALAALIIRVRRIGQESAAMTATIAYYTAVLILLLLRGWNAVGTDYFGLTLLLAWAGIAWLLPRGTAAGPVAVMPVSAAEHQTLVRDMLRRRSVRLALTGLLRQGPAGDGSPSDFEEQRAALERASDEHAGPVDSDFALATVAGRTPWQNALAALAMGTLLSLPFSTVRIVVSADAWSGDDTQPLLVAFLALLSLPALCMIFGYFYARVRGDNPIAKSLALLVAALLVELPVYVQTLVAVTADPGVPTTPQPTSEEALIGTLVAVGNIAFVSIGLGLWWEWRLMRLAGEPWARVRSIRTLRTLGAPLVAVVIAIATTAATALVNNVIAPLPVAQVGNTPGESTPSPTPRP